MNDILDQLVHEHEANIKELNAISGTNTAPILRVPEIISKYTNLHTKVLLLVVEADSRLDELYKDAYFQIKTSSHDLSILNLTTHQEINKFALMDPSYMELTKNIQFIETRAKQLEKNTKIISDYSFHFKTRLDYQKFFEGEV